MPGSIQHSTIGLLISSLGEPARPSNALPPRLLSPPSANCKQDLNDGHDRDEPAHPDQAGSRHLKLENAFSGPRQFTQMCATGPSGITPASVPSCVHQAEYKPAMLAFAIGSNIDERDQAQASELHPLERPAQRASWHHRSASARLPAINTLNRTSSLAPRSAQTPTQTSFNAMTPTANPLPTFLPTTYTQLRPPISNRTSRSPPFRSVPPSPATRMSIMALESNEKPRSASVLNQYHQLDSIGSALTGRNVSPGLYPTEHATSYFPPSNFDALKKSSSGLVDPHLLTPHPHFAPTEEITRGYFQGLVFDSVSVLIGLETIQQSPVVRQADGHPTGCGTEVDLLGKDQGARVLGASPVRPVLLLSPRHSTLAAARSLNDQTTLQPALLKHVPKQAWGGQVAGPMSEPAQPECNPTELSPQLGFVGADDELRKQDEEATENGTLKFDTGLKDGR